MRRLVVAPILAIVLTFSLTFAQGGAALADPGVPVSIFGGTYVAMCVDRTAIEFQMPDGHLRWEVNGVPVSSYGVDDVARAATLGYDSPLALVLYGRIRGTFWGASSDGTVMAFRMPDGTVRYELNGIPLDGAH